MKPAMALSSVDFPQPLAPSATTMLFSAMSTETRSSAWMGRPPWPSKKTLACWTWSMDVTLREKRDGIAVAPTRQIESGAPKSAVTKDP